MSTMVPMYGFGGGSGGTGASLTVTAPAGATVTVSKDGKSKTKVADASGVAVFKGLATGDWLVTITDGQQTAQKTVTITADYAAAITFFTATIHVTYPAGSTCTATDGTTTLSAPDTSGTWDCVVPNAGTWTVSLDGGLAESINVTTSGETYTIDKWYLYNLGDQHTDATGGWEAETYKGGVATIDANSMTVSAQQSGQEGYVVTNNSIDVSRFSTLCVNVTAFSSGDNSPNRCSIRIITSRDFMSSSEISKTYVASAKVYIVDISSITQAVYINPYVISAENAKHTMTINKIWLGV